MKVKINFYSNILWRIFWLSLRKIFFRKIAILAPQLCPPLCLLALLASLPPWFCQQQWRPQFAGLAKLPQSGWRDTSAMQQSVSSDPVILHSICLLPYDLKVVFRAKSKTFHIPRSEYQFPFSFWWFFLQHHRKKVPKFFYFPHLNFRLVRPWILCTPKAMVTKFLSSKLKIHKHTTSMFSIFSRSVVSFSLDLESSL